MGDCAKVLIQQTDVSLMDESDYLAYLDVIDEQSFGTAKTSGGISIPGYLDGDYNSFDAARKSFFQLKNYVSDKKRSEGRVRVFLSDEQIRAWRDCELKNRNGLELLPEGRRTGDSITFKLAYFGTPGITLRITLRGDSCVIDGLAEKHTEIPHGGERSFVAKATEKGGDFRIIANSTHPAGLTSSLFVSGGPELIVHAKGEADLRAWLGVVLNFGKPLIGEAPVSQTSFIAPEDGIYRVEASIEAMDSQRYEVGKITNPYLDFQLHSDGTPDIVQVAVHATSASIDRDCALHKGDKLSLRVQHGVATDAPPAGQVHGSRRFRYQLSLWRV